MSELLSAYENLTEFTFDGRTYGVTQTDSIVVAKGVVCDTYEIPEVHNEWDLGIIKVEPARSTPRQLVVGGMRTIEMHLAGDGWLTTMPSLFSEIFDRHAFCDEDEPPQEDAGIASSDRYVDVRPGEVMQWIAGSTALVAAELCWPPYQEGRYHNLP